MEGQDLWTFECQRHGTFDVWGTDWSEVDPLDRPYRYADGNFEPSDVRKVRCPTCKISGNPVGPRENLA